MRHKGRTISESRPYRDAVDQLFSHAVICHGARSLADLAKLDFAALLEETGLGGIADQIDLAQAMGAIRSKYQVGRVFSEALDALDDRRRAIARKRTYAEVPEKLVALGREFGVSRERARQLEVNLKRTIEATTASEIRRAVRWLRRTIGPAAAPGKFRMTLNLLVGDALTEWRTAVEVAVMAESGYAYLDGVVGDDTFRELIRRTRRRAREFADGVGVIDERGLREALGGERVPEWESLVRNAGLVRMGTSLVLRSTRRVRVYLALWELGDPATRETIARVAGLADNTTLSSLLSSDPLFVRLTKDKWGLAAWTDDPYEGVVTEIVKRIDRAGGEIGIEELLNDIPERFDVLPATVKNYLATKKFIITGGYARVVLEPSVPLQDLSDARDVLWTRSGVPVLRFIVGTHHLKGNSQKVPVAVAQHLGVALDGSTKIPFTRPAGVDAASVIWRSYDPNGPEIGRLREALLESGASPGDEVFLVLKQDGLRLLSEGSTLLKRKPSRG